MTSSKLTGALLACLCSAVTFAADGLTQFTFPECSVTCIQDTPARHPSALFSSVKGDPLPLKQDSFLSSINVFLLEKKGERFLIDAGNDQRRGSLKGKLEALKVDPATIKAVFITHIHPDHVGGLLWDNAPLFANATIYIARVEYEAWQKDARRAALGRYLTPYQSRLQLIDYGRPLPGGLLPIKKAGHTPGHTVYKLALSATDNAIFVGDILHAVELQVPRPDFCARYDSAPAEAVKSRLEIYSEKALFFGAHFPFPGCATITPATPGEFTYTPYGK